jgi:hypothetical protein
MDGHHSRLMADAALHHALFSGPVVRMHACKLAMKGNKLLAQLLEDDHTTHVCFSTHGCRTAANVAQDSKAWPSPPCPLLTPACTSFVPCFVLQRQLLRRAL